jgi:hypothetical protein
MKAIAYSMPLTSQAVAGLGHSPTGDKEQGRDQDIEQIQHGSSVEIHEDDLMAMGT